MKWVLNKSFIHWIWSLLTSSLSILTMNKLDFHTYLFRMSLVQLFAFWAFWKSGYLPLLQRKCSTKLTFSRLQDWKARFQNLTKRTMVTVSTGTYHQSQYKTYKLQKQNASKFFVVIKKEKTFYWMIIGSASLAYRA